MVTVTASPLASESRWGFDYGQPPETGARRENRKRTIRQHGCGRRGYGTYIASLESAVSTINRRTYDSTEHTLPSTDDDIKSYLSTNYFPSASSSDLDKLLMLYPQDVTQGSPFGTGDLNAITAQFKRMSAIQGDFFFQGPRRFLLDQRSGKQAAWSYLSKKFKAVAPVVGSIHGSDLVGNSTVQIDAMINFVNNLDPNGPTVPQWPQYTTASPSLLTVYDDPTPINITLDNFRADGIALLQQLFFDNPF
ncbi:hypothetical protein EIP86_002439 [Pleurotus ostreatoroseus]|nr:hypothetical protein EIP86_002439 [Pleurotus ostreatoroseus]